MQMVPTNVSYLHICTTYGNTADDSGSLFRALNTMADLVNSSEARNGRGKAR